MHVINQWLDHLGFAEEPPYADAQRADSKSSSDNSSLFSAEGTQTTTERVEAAFRESFT